ncbi:V-type ATP synthase subunit D [Desulfovibrio inopinatus]|uniref:V-type ATP synthase subunit D n=1 Tax=Desulfovibrio inopinatus TaxID=102109 RepID=UPI00040DEE9C|nr:V-type ATP synthase subunit D [Desulfovibrio inopinatus]
MAKIKLTKNELKVQRENLIRYSRYLPTLKLKKQQLQAEVRILSQSLMEKEEQLVALEKEIEPWVGLFSEPFEFAPYIAVKNVRLSEGNIVGVAIPVFEELEFDAVYPDLFTSPYWVDEGIRVLRERIRLNIQIKVLRMAQERILSELETTTQRVNLFEKVKIPESKEHIRVIRIFLGDQQTAAVVRAKIAKSKFSEQAGAK